MLSRLSRIVPLLALLAATAACQGPDVGQECSLTWQDTTTAPIASDLYTIGGADYLEFNAANGCDNLVCVVSPAAAGTTYGSTRPGVGYCSKPCVSNRDCYQSETELVCRDVVLDLDFLNRLDPETRERYLGNIKDSSYCAVER